jgi:rare lipoprotein A
MLKLKFALIFFALAVPMLFSANYPINQSTILDEYGVASYYGDEFHGRKTASGEKYNKNELTCAHKTYPFGTKIRVTRLDNKKSVIVRVNDRGPFIKGYVVDLSKKAAQEIAMVEDGIVKVKIELVEKKSNDTSSEVVKPEERSTSESSTAKNDDAPASSKASVPATDAPKPEKTSKKSSKKKEEPIEVEKDEAQLATAKNYKSNDLYQIELKKPEKKGYGVQVSIISNYENVLKEVAKLQGHWGGKVLMEIEGAEHDSKTMYKLILGPFDEKKSAEKNQRLAAKKGYKKCFVVEL